MTTAQNTAGICDHDGLKINTTHRVELNECAWHHRPCTVNFTRSETCGNCGTHFLGSHHESNEVREGGRGTRAAMSEFDTEGETGPTDDEIERAIEIGALIPPEDDTGLEDEPRQQLHAHDTRVFPVRTSLCGRTGDGFSPLPACSASWFKTWLGRALERGNRAEIDSYCSDCADERDRRELDSIKLVDEYA